MDELGLLHLIVLPIGLGLLGFLEPCSIGSSLLFVKFLEGKSGTAKVSQTVLFAATRAIFIGTLGAAAVFVGAAFAAYQKTAWIVLGVAYLALGLTLLAGRGAWLSASLGTRVSALRGRRGSVALGLIFGLNIPACAAPLLAALLGMSAATGTSGVAIVSGFVSLAFFGLALSLPLVAAVFFERARQFLERIARAAARFPKWAGAVLIALGLWSIRFGMAAEVSLTRASTL